MSALRKARTLAGLTSWMSWTLEPAFLWTLRSSRELSDGWWACFRRECSGQARTFWDVTGPRHVGFGSALHRQMRRSRAHALGLACREPGPRRDSQQTL